MIEEQLKPVTDAPNVDVVSVDAKESEQCGPLHL